MVIRTNRELDRVFHALADPTRRQILQRLARQDQPVMELVRMFAVSQPAITKHLNVLEKTGLITRRKHGRLRYCRLRPAALSATLCWIERCRNYWDARLDALEDYLAESSSHGSIRKRNVNRRMSRLLEVKSSDRLGV